MAAASRNRFTVETSRFPESSPILSSSSTSSAPLPARPNACGARSDPDDALHGKQRIDVAGGLRRCGGARLLGAAGVSGSRKPVELVRRVLLAGDPSVVPFGP